MAETKEKLSSLFLKTFISELLSNVKTNNKEITAETPENMFPERFEDYTQTIQVPHPEKKLPIVPMSKPVIIEKPSLHTQNFNHHAQTKFPPQLIQQPKMHNIFSPPMISQETQEQEIPYLGKLTPLISDPEVESIESPGPNQNILVKKRGALQRTSISLTPQEIETIIKDFSQKTRIPLIEGTFKAALSDLIITAVISEFVGSRFVIQKRNLSKSISAY